MVSLTVSKLRLVLEERMKMVGNVAVVTEKYQHQRHKYKKRKRNCGTRTMWRFPSALIPR